MNHHAPGDAYLPRVITTIGEKPACLVNASTTYVGNDEIYLFGGFDEQSDEVYNHVLKLDITARRWSLVDNFGDIPGVRMGHTACLWQDDKIIVYGGENEHRKHLGDVIILNLDTKHWTQPELNGPTPRGRARHAAVVHDDKLFISGGMVNSHQEVSDDVCYLDLKTWTWSRSWRFVARYDHFIWPYNNKLWASGGLSEDMERTGDVWWLDLQGVPAFQGAPQTFNSGRSTATSSPAPNSSLFTPPARTDSTSRSTSYAANSSSVQISATSHFSRKLTSVAPGSVSTLTFVSGPDLPIPNAGVHFQLYSSGFLLDFATPAGSESPSEISLNALDLDTLRWQKLADGKELFQVGHRWHCCCLNKDGTQAWLLGSPFETASGETERLSDILPIDFRKLGLLGNKLTKESRYEASFLPSSDSQSTSHLSSIGADLALTFDVPPEEGAGTDFVITAEAADEGDDEHGTDRGEAEARYSKPIHVHRFLLTARWPHFARLYNSQMTEFHTKKMHIPEPYSAVRAFLFYLYTDSITADPSAARVDMGAGLAAPTLEDVAGMLVMSNIYDMPRLRHLCVSRLVREMDVQYAALIFERAMAAQETWLRRRAASFCMIHWGRIVRTETFKCLPREAMLELCEETDSEGRVVGGDELEAVGGLGGGRLGHRPMQRDGRKRGRLVQRHRESDYDGETLEDESMDVE